MISMENLGIRWGKDNENSTLKYTNMNIQLLEGQFNKKDALDLITQMIAVKIEFHENKIQQASNEEDIKMRESRIKALQNNLKDLRAELESLESMVSLNSQIKIE